MPSIRSATFIAGGENRRFPYLKSFIKIDNSSIIERNLSLLKDIFDEVYINTNIPDRYFYLDLPLIGDVIPSRGPMSGIYSSLINVSGDGVFIVACDMPFIKKDLIHFICKRHEETLLSKEIDATVPIYDGKPQPLIGIYGKTLISYLENAILNNMTSLKRFLNEIKTNFIPETDIIRVDDGKSFININTPEDYKRIIENFNI